ncbi:hypothetical protein C5748_18110 [Phyllobacterium phragmitis]|uniref:Uncharacterized protein n=1 Tax=Phyllobacterium phragmitis TaxID=2670329 RepID=A0A2S9INK8_9HYPH|nr:hypothetical protein [Phyllobacterium phragmitis]PRD42072.1 hypothetical protein C5748_18110 [Phyllobacterium phragmitis]
MTTTEIPHEIMHLAQEIARFHVNQYTRQFDTLAWRIADALMARDQRAADIAKNAADHRLRASSLSLPIETSPIIAKDRANVAARIASAILTYDKESS